MRYMTKRVTVLYAVIVSAALSCTKGGSVGGDGSASIAGGTQLPQLRQAPAIMNLPELIATESSGGDMVVKVDTNTDSVIKTSNSSHGSAAFKAVALAVPKGALSGSGTLTIAEAGSLATPAVAASLGIQQVAQAGPAVIIAADAMSIVSPLTIALPLSERLGLSGDTLAVIAIIPGAKQTSQLQVLADDKVRITDNFVYADITQFGAYQVIHVSAKPTTTVVTTDIKPVTQPGGGETVASIGALMLATPEDLPTCNSQRRGALYYIQSTKQFQTCDGGAWTVINLMGATGPQGPQGAKAPDPVPFFAIKTVSGRFDSGGRFISTTTRTEFENYGGKVLRVCSTDTWTESVIHGSLFVTNDYGDKGCPIDQERYLGCDSNYMTLDGATCVDKCSNDMLSQCNTRPMCEGSGMTWDGNSCLGSCSSSNLQACNSRGICQSKSSQGLIWFESTCQLSCSDSDLGACKSQPKCEASGMTWSGSSNSCLGICSQTNPGACVSVQSCNKQSMVWSDVSNTCLGVCGSGNLKACTSLASCQANWDSNYFYSSPGSWQDGQCQSGCSAGKLATPDGCKDPVICDNETTGLPKHWDRSTNSCTDMTYQTIAPDDGDPGATKILTGTTYNSPVWIKAGTYEISGDITFNNVVVIDDQTQILTQGNNSLAFNKTLYARGSADDGKGIVFGPSANYSTGNWKGITIFNNHDYPSNLFNPFELDGTYRVGTKVQNLTINGASGAALALSGYLDHIKIDATPYSLGLPNSKSNAQYSGLYLAHSELWLPWQIVNQNNAPLYLVKNKINSNYQLDFSNNMTVLWANNFNSNSADKIIYISGEATAIFNDFSQFSLSCGSSGWNGLIYGNKIGTGQGDPNNAGKIAGLDPNCHQDANFADNISDKVYVRVTDRLGQSWSYNYLYFYLASGMQSPSLFAQFLNATKVLDPMNDPVTASWKAVYYDANGTEVPLSDGTGASFNFKPKVAATPVTVNITAAESGIDLIGLLSRTFPVN